MTQSIFKAAANVDIYNVRNFLEIGNIDVNSKNIVNACSSMTFGFRYFYSISIKIHSWCNNSHCKRCFVDPVDTQRTFCCCWFFFYCSKAYSLWCSQKFIINKVAIDYAKLRHYHQIIERLLPSSKN
mgnify:FL=1